MTNEQTLRKILNQRPKIHFFGTDFFSGAGELNVIMRYFYLIIHDYENGENYSSSKEVRIAIRTGMNSILNEGAEPRFENNQNGSYLILAQSIALIKNKETLWNLFTKTEKEKLTLFMKMFLFMWNFNCNDKNDYTTGISLKNEILNKETALYKLSNDMIILPCIDFFGDISEIDRILTQTKYEDLIKEIVEKRCPNIFRAWTVKGFKLANGEDAPGSRALFGTYENSINKNYSLDAYIKLREKEYINEYYAGSGKGCCIPFFYKNRSLTEYPLYICKEIFNTVFSGGSCKSIVHIDEEEDFSAHITRGGISPYEGETGMMLTFNTTDDFGSRSSIVDSETAFILTISTLLTLKNIKGIEINNFDKNKILIGMSDFIYKKEKHYIGYKNGKEEIDMNLVDSNILREYWKDTYGGEQ